MAADKLSLPEFITKAINPTPPSQTACVDSEDDDCCKTTGITDHGITKSANWKALLSAAVLAYNVLNSLRMAKLQRSLGQDYLKLAQDHRAYYNQRFKPLEIDLTKEALRQPKYERKKIWLTTGQMLVSARGQNAGTVDKAISCTGRYCTGQRAAIMTDQLLQQAATDSLVSGLAHRYIDREEINHNNLRWEKREQVMKIGRDIPTEMVSAASLAAGTFGSLGKQAGQAAEGVMNFLGQDRNPTRYPERRGPITTPSYTYRTKSTTTPDISKRPIYRRPNTQQTTEIKVAG